MDSVQVELPAQLLHQIKAAAQMDSRTQTPTTGHPVSVLLIQNDDHQTSTSSTGNAYFVNGHQKRPIHAHCLTLPNHRFPMSKPIRFSESTLSLETSEFPFPLPNAPSSPSSKANGKLSEQEMNRIRYLTYGTSDQLAQEYGKFMPWPAMTEFRFRRRLRRLKRKARKLFTHQLANMKRMMLGSGGGSRQKGVPRRCASMHQCNNYHQSNWELNHSASISRSSSLSSLLNLIEEANKNLQQGYREQQQPSTSNQAQGTPTNVPQCPPRLKRAQSSLTVADTRARLDALRFGRPSSLARSALSGSSGSLLWSHKSNDYQIAFIESKQTPADADSSSETHSIKSLESSGSDSGAVNLSQSSPGSSTEPEASAKDVQGSRVLCVRSHFQMNNGTVYLEDSDWEMCSEADMASIGDDSLTEVGDAEDNIDQDEEVNDLIEAKCAELGGLSGRDVVSWMMGMNGQTASPPSLKTPISVQCSVPETGQNLQQNQQTLASVVNHEETGQNLGQQQRQVTPTSAKNLEENDQTSGQKKRPSTPTSAKNLKETDQSFQPNQQTFVNIENREEPGQNLDQQQRPSTPTSAKNLKETDQSFQPNQQTFVNIENHEEAGQNLDQQPLQVTPTSSKNFEETDQSVQQNPQTLVPETCSIISNDDDEHGEFVEDLDQQHPPTSVDAAAAAVVDSIIENDLISKQENNDEDEDASSLHQGNNVPKVDDENGDGDANPLLIMSKLDQSTTQYGINLDLTESSPKLPSSSSSSSASISFAFKPVMEPSPSLLEHNVPEYNTRCPSTTMTTTITATAHAASGFEDNEMLMTMTTKNGVDDDEQTRTKASAEEDVDVNGDDEEEASRLDESRVFGKTAAALSSTTTMLMPMIQEEEFSEDIEDDETTTKDNNNLELTPPLSQRQVNQAETPIQPEVAPTTTNSEPLPLATLKPSSSTSILQSNNINFCLDSIENLNESRQILATLTSSVNYVEEPTESDRDKVEEVVLKEVHIATVDADSDLNFDDDDEHHQRGTNGNNSLSTPPGHDSMHQSSSSSSSSGLKPVQAQLQAIESTESMTNPGGTKGEDGQGEEKELKNKSNIDLTINRMASDGDCGGHLPLDHPVPIEPSTTMASASASALIANFESLSSKSSQSVLKPAENVYQTLPEASPQPAPPTIVESTSTTMPAYAVINKQNKKCRNTIALVETPPALPLSPKPQPMQPNECTQTLERKERKQVASQKRPAPPPPLPPKVIIESGHLPAPDVVPRETPTPPSLPPPTQNRVASLVQQLTNQMSAPPSPQPLPVTPTPQLVKGKQAHNRHGIFKSILANRTTTTATSKQTPQESKSFEQQFSDYFQSFFHKHSSSKTLSSKTPTKQSSKTSSSSSSQFNQPPSTADALCAKIVQEFEQKFITETSKEQRPQPSTNGSGGGGDANWMFMFMLQNQKQMFQEILHQMIGAMQQVQLATPTTTTSSSNQGDKMESIEAQIDEFKQLIAQLQDSLKQQQQQQQQAQMPLPPPATPPQSSQSDAAIAAQNNEFNKVIPDSPKESKFKRNFQRKASGSKRKDTEEETETPPSSSLNQNCNASNRFVNKIILNNSINQYNFTVADGGGGGGESSTTPTSATSPPQIVNMINDNSCQAAMNVFDMSSSNKNKKNDPKTSKTPTTKGEAPLKSTLVKVNVNRGQQQDGFGGCGGGGPEHKTVLQIKDCSHKYGGGGWLNTLRYQLDKKKNKAIVEKMKKCSSSIDLQAVDGDQNPVTAALRPRSVMGGHDGRAEEQGVSLTNTSKVQVKLDSQVGKQKTKSFRNFWFDKKAVAKERPSWTASCVDISKGGDGFDDHQDGMKKDKKKNGKRSGHRLEISDPEPVGVESMFATIRRDPSRKYASREGTQKEEVRSKPSSSSSSSNFRATMARFGSQLSLGVFGHHHHQQDEDEEGEDHETLANHPKPVRSKSTLNLSKKAQRKVIHYKYNSNDEEEVDDDEEEETLGSSDQTDSSNRNRCYFASGSQDTILYDDDGTSDQDADEEEDEDEDRSSLSSTNRKPVVTFTLPRNFKHKQPSAQPHPQSILKKDPVTTMLEQVPPLKLRAQLRPPPSWVYHAPSTTSSTFNSQKTSKLARSSLDLRRLDKDEEEEEMRSQEFRNFHRSNNMFQSNSHSYQQQDREPDVPESVSNRIKSYLQYAASQTSNSASPLGIAGYVDNNAPSHHHFHSHQYKYPQDMASSWHVGDSSASLQSSRTSFVSSTGSSSGGSGRTGPSSYRMLSDNRSSGHHPRYTSASPSHRIIRRAQHRV